MRSDVDNEWSAFEIRKYQLDDNDIGKVFQRVKKNERPQWKERMCLQFLRVILRTRTRRELQLYNVSELSERITVDILGTLPKSYRGNKYTLWWS